MTEFDRLQFIEQYCNNIRDKIMLTPMPDSWGGWEFREYIAKQFDKARLTVDRKGKRYKDFQNELLINERL
jgi:hypothetical protein